MIRLQGISRTYVTGDTQIQALRHADLEIGAGESVAIMGQSGSGKSTMMNIIGLLDRPSSGEYWLAGKNVAGLSEHARARLRGSAFGFVFQSYSLLPRMTALEQVELPLIYQGVRDRRRRAAEALVPGWSGGPAASSSHPALWRRTAAGRDRPFAGGASAGRAGGRTDRRAGHGDGERHHDAAQRPGRRTRDDAHSGHT